MLNMILGIIRHGMTFGGGYLVNADLVTATDWDSAIAAVITLFGIAWSIYDKKAK